MGDLIKFKPMKKIKLKVRKEKAFKPLKAATGLLKVGLGMAVIGSLIPLLRR